MKAAIQSALIGETVETLHLNGEIPKGSKGIVQAVGGESAGYSVGTGGGMHTRTYDYEFFLLVKFNGKLATLSAKKVKVV